MVVVVTDFILLYTDGIISVAKNEQESQEMLFCVLRTGVKIGDLQSVE